MTVLLLIAVAFAGGIGSALRYLADTALPARVKARYPWGTTLINLSGSFVLGVVTGLAADGGASSWTIIVGTGLMGGYTTFSTSSFESIRLLADGERVAAVMNGFGLLVACVLVAGLGVAMFN